MRFQRIADLFTSGRLSAARKDRPRSRPRRRPVLLEALEPRRVLADGMLDSTFNTDGLFTHPITQEGDFRSAVGQQSDGTLVFAGNTLRDESAHPDRNVYVVRVSPNGSVISTTIEDPEGPGPVDQFVYDNPDFLVVIAAGNEGSCQPGLSAPGGFVDYPSLGSPASAKNGLTVGASRSSRTTGGLSASETAAFTGGGPEASQTSEGLTLFFRLVP